MLFVSGPLNNLLFGLMLLQRGVKDPENIPPSGCDELNLSAEE